MAPVPPERSSTQKMVDSIFHSTPMNIVTSDQGMQLKYLDNLNKHQEGIERSLHQISQGSRGQIAHRVPDYMPTPEIIINTGGVENSAEVADSLHQLVGSHETLVQISQNHGAYFARMVRNQGVTHELLEEGNTIAADSLMEQWIANELLWRANGLSAEAYEQRQQMIRQSGMTNKLLGVSLAVTTGIATAAGLQRSKQIDLQTMTNRLLDKGNQLFQHQIDLTELGVRLHSEGNQILSEGNDIALHGNRIALELGKQAFLQRNQMIGSLAGLLQSNENLIDVVMHSGMTVAHELGETREHLHMLLTDISGDLQEIREEEVISRIAMLQSLYAMRSTFIQTHEQQMFEMQKQTGVLRDAILLTERDKESRKLWTKAERKRAAAKTEDEFNEVLGLLKEAHERDDMNGLVYLSSGIVQSALNNPEQAAIAFTEADALLQNDPLVDSFTLMSLAQNLHQLGRHEHAERVLRKAMKMDMGNPEVWFAYAKAAWRGGKKDNARYLLREQLLPRNHKYYLDQLQLEPDLKELLSEFNYE